MIFRSTGLAVAWFMAWHMSAALADDASCESLDIHLAGTAIAGDRNCRTGEMGSFDDGIAETELIEVKGIGFVFFLHHVNAGLRSYLTRQDFDKTLDGASNFKRVENMTVHPATGGYSVRKFTGITEDDQGVPCFALMQYSGTSFNGARHLVFGLYCQFRGDEVADDRIDEVMAGIDTDF